MATYTVVKGDCLWTIARDELGNAYRWKEIAELNNIKSPYTIYPGNQLTLPDSSGGGSSGGGGGSGSDPTPPPNTTYMATIQFFGLQAGTDRTLFAVWQWDKANTENYKIRWWYNTKNEGVAFLASETTVTINQATYTYPENAINGWFHVIPISKTHEVNGSDVAYWNAKWSTAVSWNFSDNPPKEPPTPTVELDGFKLTATLDNLEDLNASSVQFQVVKDNTTIFNTGTANISTGHASYSCTVDAGGQYKVRARTARDGQYSEWSDYSSNVETIPAAPSGITTLRAASETSVYIAWGAVANAESYEIQYATEREYFDGSNALQSITGIESTQYTITGLETGDEYFFRIRAVNAQGNSSWSDIKSVTIGKTPSAPTTWSSTTTAIVGDSVTLYWIHNSEDGSSQQLADVEYTVGDNTQTITLRTQDEPDDEKTSYYTLDTSKYTEGTKILWRIRTAGITMDYGDWSVQRTIDVYAPPTLALTITKQDGTDISVLESFPFYVKGIAGPATQTPLSYHLEVISKNTYETTDQIGNTQTVSAGDQVYSNYFDTGQQLLVELSAGNIDLENNMEYTVNCTVSMNSGLTATASVDFSVAWTDAIYEPAAELGFDTDTVTAYIRPYCVDENNELINGVTLAVYRREFDGQFVEIASGLDNMQNTFVTDPHPALDYARYRIVATDVDTGAISFNDIPGYPIGEHAIILQWDETWTEFDGESADPFVEPVWSGSMLKLPYNVDVSNDYDKDNTNVEYIGRRHPVSYYGTQIGETASWSCEIPKSDKETLYALRRLAIWMGDVYVREPSGSGYWANIKVSFSQTHLELTIPITFEITRVEGGA